MPGVRRIGAGGGVVVEVPLAISEGAPIIGSEDAIIRVVQPGIQRLLVVGNPEFP
jgi:hypothetical protein